MLAAVKTPHTEIRMRGEIPARVLEALRAEYGLDLKESEEDDEELVDVFATDWYQSVKSTTTPGDVLRMYRETRQLTQSELGHLLGGLVRQQISNMENGIRPISLAMARKLAKVFAIPADRFLAL